MKINACLSNKSDLWQTPTYIYDFYKKRNFFDPCPINPCFDGLNIEWKKRNFVNPPYSQIEKWIEKAIAEKNKGNESILLIPARTDTKWFRKLVETGSVIIFIQGRLKFSGIGSAPFPSMLVYLVLYQNTIFGYMGKESFEKYFGG